MTDATIADSRRCMSKAPGDDRAEWQRRDRALGLILCGMSVTGLRTRQLLLDALAIGAPLAVGAVGGVATAPQIPTWYRTLRKPAWNPPDAVFGPVWTALYLLMGVALALARRADMGRSGRLEAAFGLQLALNLAWSLVFFGRRDLQGGLVVIVLLWAAIAATIVEFAKVRPLSAALLLPYLAWVSFATVLNAEVWRLNR
jgi:benzodiazapine receptor